MNLRRKSPIYHQKSHITPHQKSLTSMKKTLHSIANLKEPYTPSKEPYIPTPKEPHIPHDEPYIHDSPMFLHTQRRRGGGLGSRPKKMYGERLGDGVEYHLMSPTPHR